MRGSEGSSPSPPKIKFTPLKLNQKERYIVGDEVEKDLIPAQKLGMETFLIDRENKIINPNVRKITSLSELKKILI